MFEMLVVLAMIAVVASFSFPYFLRDTPAAKATRGAQEVAQAMRMARFRAIGLNREVYFHLEPGGVDDYFTAYANLGNPGDVPTGNPEEIAASRVILPDQEGSWRGRRLQDGVRFETGSAGAAPGGGSLAGPIDLPSNPIVFESRGGVRWPNDEDSWSGTVYVSHPDAPQHVRAVTISRAGLIKVWYLRGSDWQ